jgi:hypothetical protein
VVLMHFKRLAHELLHCAVPFVRLVDSSLAVHIVRTYNASRAYRASLIRGMQFRCLLDSSWTHQWQASRSNAGYAIVEGVEGAPEVLKVLQPKVVIPFINNNVDNSGALSKVLSSAGRSDADYVNQWLVNHGVNGVEVPGPQEFGVPLDVRLPEGALQAAP